MNRKTPLTRRTPLRSKTRIKPRNAKRGGSRFPRRRDRDYCAWIRTHDCAVRGLGDWIDGAALECQGRVECAHVKSRGAGGDDVANTVPLCTRHHREQHAIGVRSFGARYGIDLAREALWLAIGRQFTAPGPTPGHHRAGESDPA